MVKSSEDELRDVLNETAQEISRLYSNPATWESWLVYLLGRLEEEVIQRNPGNMDSYKEMLAGMQDEIRNRLRTGGW